MTVVIRSGREPFEVSMMFVCLAYGLAALAFYDKIAATSIRLYPAFGGVVFLALLAVGAAVTLFGLFGPGWRTVHGVHVERAGLVMLTGLCASYAVWAPFAVGFRGTGLLLFLGIAVAMPGVWRLCQIHRFLTALEQEGSEGASP